MSAYHWQRRTSLVQGLSGDFIYELTVEIPGEVALVRIERVMSPF